jgi:hypothetical protein
MLMGIRKEKLNNGAKATAQVVNNIILLMILIGHVFIGIIGVFVC